MQPHMGRIEVICGSMFCGKTEELIRRVRRAIIAQQKIKVFKPSLDDRFGIQKIASHTGQTLAGIPIKNSSEILHIANGDTTVVAIDEAQFFRRGHRQRGSGTRQHLQHPRNCRRARSGL